MKVLFFSQDGERVEQLVLALRLRWPDLKPLVVSQGGVGIQVVEQEEPDLVMMCEDLPDLTMWQAIREVRRFSDIPVIVASECRDEMDVVKAIELGADDYINMPCNLMIVVARIVALMRRVGLSRDRSEESPIFCGDLVINPATYEVYLKNERLMLTPTEFKLLYLLAKNRHMTLSQEFIQRVIWADDIEAGDTLKKYIQRLRRKLGDDARNPIWIKTVHGVGYRFSSPTPIPTEASSVGAIH
ncbi:MAG: response regulator transcription factor [Chloroflexi bacterium]|nr:response regulator transcription factor [Chloroflexota bacterium]MCH8869578.1 response regulator transcription factor [Chloroflexota bacterium]MCH9038176.1 response regulator transcription factor [Chloroflexota bacterium]MCI0770520.1 response regulator transcription factor [Chloroflexota bacterium]MCI0790189.1 response regulator transcription factor [Chloroflexota bacterium]